MSNEESQQDEICVLQSIYNNEEFYSSTENGKITGRFDAFIELPPSFIVTYKNLDSSDEGDPHKIQIDHLPPVSLHFELPQQYPCDSPPEFQLSCAWLSVIKIGKLALHLDHLWEKNKGTEVLFTWTHFLKEDVLEFLEIEGSLDISGKYTNELQKLRKIKARGSTSGSLDDQSASQKVRPRSDSRTQSLDSNGAQCITSSSLVQLPKLKRSDVPKGLNQSEKYINSAGNQSGVLNNSLIIVNSSLQKTCGNQLSSTSQSNETTNIEATSNVVQNRVNNSEGRVSNQNGFSEKQFNRWRNKPFYPRRQTDYYSDWRKPGERARSENSRRKYRNYAPLNSDRSSAEFHSSKQEIRNNPHGPKKSDNWMDKIRKSPSYSVHLHDYLIKYDEDRRKSIFGRNIFRCNICFEDRLGIKCIQFKPCDHIYCRECIKGYFEVRISEGSVNSMPCPQEKCSSEASQQQIRELVGPNLFARYDSLLLSATLNAMDDITYCPRTVCQCPVMRESDEKLATCPSCQYVFCVYCRMTYHGVEPCRLKTEEKRVLISQYQNGDAATKQMLESRYGKRQILNIVQTAQSENWISENSKQCPHCNAAIEKSDGCNRMVCWKCSTYFCWLCSAVLNPADPYKHFYDPTSRCRDLLFHGTYEEDDEDDDDDDFFEYDFFEIED